MRGRIIQGVPENVLAMMREQYADADQLVEHLAQWNAERNAEHPMAVAIVWTVRDDLPVIVWRWVADVRKSGGGSYVMVMSQAMYLALFLAERAGFYFLGNGPEKPDA